MLSLLATSTHVWLSSTSMEEPTARVVMKRVSCWTMRGRRRVSVEVAAARKARPKVRELAAKLSMNTDSPFILSSLAMLASRERMKKVKQTR